MPGKKNKKTLDGQDNNGEKQQDQNQVEQSDDNFLLDQLNKQHQEQDDDEVKSLIKERDGIISRPKRIYFYATRKMFKQIDQGDMDMMVDRLYDVQQQLGVHDKFEAIFYQITEVNSILLEQEDREKFMNLSRHSSRESLALSSHSPPIIVMNAANDPNLVVDPWDSTATRYYKFKRRFVSTYVQNDAYNTANRFAAYARLVGPKGRDIIDDLEQTPNCLNTAMMRMKERFAHKEQVRTDVERKLVNIPFVKSQFDAQGFGAINSATESSLQVLKQAGIENSYIDRVVFGTVRSKIPRPMLDRFLRKTTTPRTQTS